MCLSSFLAKNFSPAAPRACGAAAALPRASMEKLARPAARRGGELFFTSLTPYLAVFLLFFCADARRGQTWATLAVTIIPVSPVGGVATRGALL